MTSSQWLLQHDRTTESTTPVTRPCPPHLTRGGRQLSGALMVKLHSACSPNRPTPARTLSADRIRPTRRSSRETSTGRTGPPEPLELSDLPLAPPFWSDEGGLLADSLPVHMWGGDITTRTIYREIPMTDPRPGGRHLASAAAVQNCLQTCSELDLGAGSDTWQHCSSGRGDTPTGVEEGRGGAGGGAEEGRERLVGWCIHICQ